MNDVQLLLTAHVGAQRVAYGEPDSATYVLGLIVNGTPIVIDGTSDQEREELYPDGYEPAEYQVRAALLDCKDFLVLVLNDPTEAVRELLDLDQILIESDEYTLYLPVQTLTITPAEVPA